MESLISYTLLLFDMHALKGFTRLAESAIERTNTSRFKGLCMTIWKRAACAAVDARITLTTTGSSDAWSWI